MRRLLLLTGALFPVGIAIFALGFGCALAAYHHSGPGHPYAEAVGRFLLFPTRLFPEFHPGSLTDLFWKFLETSVMWALSLALIIWLRERFLSKRRDKSGLA